MPPQPRDTFAAVVVDLPSGDLVGLGFRVLGLGFRVWGLGWPSGTFFAQFLIQGFPYQVTLQPQKGVPLLQYGLCFATKECWLTGFGKPPRLVKPDGTTAEIPQNPVPLLQLMLRNTWKYFSFLGTRIPKKQLKFIHLLGFHVQ